MDFSRAFKALADDTRLAILAYLEKPEQLCHRHEEGICSCDIEMKLDLSQPTVSHHMTILIDAGLVRADRRGRYVYFDLDRAAFRSLAQAIEARVAEPN